MVNVQLTKSICSIFISFNGLKVHIALTILFIKLKYINSQVKNYQIMKLIELLKGICG